MEPLKMTDAVIARGARQLDAERQYKIINPSLTWPMLAALEPALAQLRELVRGADSGGDSFCAQAFWYKELKPELVKLVGFGRSDSHPILCTGEAYGTAYQALRHDLPPCRRCPHCD